MKVGFTALGGMGLGLAANLLKSTHDVTTYSRTRSTVGVLVAFSCGARFASSAR
ncbi:NAD(P)-binding domain-containing protein [Mesorhizobium sp. IMUNJ 23033]|uniref:NAD(P)-binding domain-containing protein n=1 Tax=Mesorhizobium sp. IMUNJ 23033 TaxID=3378039 RepID=UPI00384A635E